MELRNLTGKQLTDKIRQSANLMLAIFLPSAILALLLGIFLVIRFRLVGAVIGTLLLMLPIRFSLNALPQRLDFPKTTVSSITLKFLSDYGRPNSGAAEIMVFASPLSETELDDLAPYISNPNLARTATASATSEYSDGYSAAKAIDGQIAAPHAGDEGIAWAINGEKAKGKADFTLKWKEPVEASQIVYFGRVGATYEDEGFKDVEVYLNGSQTPVLKAQLKPGDGAQRLDIPKTSVTSITLKFLSDYGRPTPARKRLWSLPNPRQTSSLKERFPRIW